MPKKTIIALALLTLAAGGAWACAFPERLLNGWYEAQFNRAQDALRSGVLDPALEQAKRNGMQQAEEAKVSAQESLQAAEDETKRSMLLRIAELERNGESELGDAVASVRRQLEQDMAAYAASKRRQLDAGLDRDAENLIKEVITSWEASQ